MTNQLIVDELNQLELMVTRRSQETVVDVKKDLINLNFTSEVSLRSI